MKWKNAGKDGLPKDREEVLISVDGITYLAEYWSHEKLFSLKGKTGKFWIHEQTIYWMKNVSEVSSDYNK